MRPPFRTSAAPLTVTDRHGQRVVFALDRADNRLVGLEKRPETVAEALKQEIEDQCADEVAEVKVEVKSRRA